MSEAADQGPALRHIELRMYEELNDFLVPELRKRSFAHEFRARTSIKDIIESLGVPHTEVELILADGRSVDFNHQPQDGERIAVYPKFEALDVTSLLRVRERPLRSNRFVLDGHLGRLARYLRLLGFDCDYRRSADDPQLARISAGEQRILLTRDRGLLKRKLVTHGLCLRSDDPRRQLEEVLQRFDLYDSIAPFSRCLSCNGQLQAVAKDEVVDGLPPRVRFEQERFRRCQSCGQVFWRGSHFGRLRALVESVKARRAGPVPSRRARRPRPRR